MGIYSPGRRRLMVALVLTSVLLLALDAQGNTALDRGRDGFQYALDPLQSGADVVTRPVRDAWRGITQYDDLERENEELREALDGQRADQIMARAAIHEFDDLLALNNMEGLGAHPTLSARVLGASPINIREEVEIDRGSAHGIETGMAVTAPGGLVGHITRVNQYRSWVLLITDRDYAVESKVISAIEPEHESDQSEPPRNAVPSEQVVPSTPPSSAPGEAEPGDESGEPPSSEPDEEEPPSSTSPPTTDEPEESGDEGNDDETDDDGETAGTDGAAGGLDGVDNEETTSSLGMLEGQGRGNDGQVVFLDESTLEGTRFRRGDVVMTHGGEPSLAPPDIPIGVVSRIERDSSSAGPRLYVELGADTSNLGYVQVVLYQPQAEAAPEDADGESQAESEGDDGDAAEVGD